MTQFAYLVSYIEILVLSKLWDQASYLLRACYFLLDEDFFKVLMVSNLNKVFYLIEKVLIEVHEILYRFNLLYNKINARAKQIKHLNGFINAVKHLGF